MAGFTSNQRINQALLPLTKVLQPYVEKRLREAYRGSWQQNLSIAAARTQPSRSTQLLVSFKSVS